MDKKRNLLIGEVVRETGLSERTLRYYEECGLLLPQRAANGHRLYAAADLLHISHIVLLKKAGFSLSTIRDLVEAREFDALALVVLQLDALMLEREQLDEGIRILQNVRSVLAKGEDVDIATMCEFIKLGERNMKGKAWQKIYDKYYSPEEQAHWKRAKSKIPVGFDQEKYSREWQDLNKRIEQSLPMDAASGKAADFLKEWNNLLEPFLAVADPEMLKSASRLWANIDEWSGEVQSPLSSEVYQFMTEVAARSEQS